jgi:anti-sigma-K factor RskA
MIVHPGGDRDEADPLVTALLRDEYAAPRDGAYWSALTRSVVARAQTAQHAAMAMGAAPRVAPWWSGFGEWRQAGMVAAVAALMAYAYTVIDPAERAVAPSTVAAGRVLDGLSTSDTGHAGEVDNVALLSAAP